MNEVARNLAGYLHVPGPMLKDVGYVFIPEFSNKLLARFGYVVDYGLLIIGTSLRLYHLLLSF